MAEKPVYGAAKIAALISVSERTIWRWAETPEGRFLEVGSVSNAGGGLGRALWTYPSSAQHLKNLMAARMSKSRQAAAHKRWPVTSVNSSQAF